MATASIEHSFRLQGERAPLRDLLRDLWDSRELVRILARKNFFVQYRRASLGVLWAIGLPLIQAVVMSVVFTQLVKIHVSDIPYPVYVFSGILPWTFFNQSVTNGTTSVVDGQSLATRIYFPRLILPLVSVLGGIYPFVPGLVILTVMALGFGVPIGPHLLYLFPAVILMIVLSFGFSLVLSALQVYFRDVKHIVAAITLPWFWASGVFFPIQRLGKLRPYFEVNPAVGMIQLFRAALHGAAPHFQTAVWWSIGWSIVLMAIGALLHRRYDRVFVDLL